MEKKINLFLNKELLNNFKNNFKNVLYQVKLLHQKNYAHFDIKPENIMIKYVKNSNLIEKMDLSDYGSSMIAPYEGIVGTPGFIDPSKLNYMTLISDIYWFGITVVGSLYYEYGPFYSNDKNDIKYELLKLNKICNYDSIKKNQWIYAKLLPYFKNYDDNFLDLLYNMIICPIEKRYNIDQVIEHPWFNY